MNKQKGLSRWYQKGVSLIEVVIGLTVLGIIAGYALPYMSLTGNALIVNERVQTATQLAQSCAEHILALRRDEANFGYATVTNTACASLPVPGGYSFAITVALSTSASDTACATAVECKSTTIEVNHSGKAQASLTLLLPVYQ
ncbi:MAG: type II secretion system GspH family protein [Gammaproteobacteria bacterium]|nr:type II secretion system GspH family protein [Gammaproteobacteria bacterium]MDH5693672.1 type II secretion system GspH family protein [Gammaproteobacteria bacterium]